MLQFVDHHRKCVTPRRHVNNRSGRRESMMLNVDVLMADLLIRCNSISRKKHKEQQRTNTKSKSVRTINTKKDVQNITKPRV